LFTVLPSKGDVRLFSGMAFQDMVAAVKPLDVAHGGAAVTSDPSSGPQQFRATLVPDERNPTSAFALVVSLSHTLGDGATYYSILNSLNSGLADDQVTALSPARHAGFADANALALGEAEATFNQSCGWICSMLCAVCRGCCCGCCCRVAKPKQQVFLVSDSWVNEEKNCACPSAELSGKAASAGNPVCVGPGAPPPVPANYFVSSNDVLSSWFYRTTKADMALMAVNMRGRQTPARAEDAGNYESLLLFRPQDCDSPGMVRKGVTQMKRAGGGLVPPGLCTSMSSHNAVVSNWATFHNGLDLPECRQTAHYPAMAAAPITIDMSAAIIFRRNPGQLAMWINSPGFDAREHAQDGPVGELLD
jgi:hypothetical protein